MSRTVDPQRDTEQGLRPRADEDFERGAYLAQEGDLIHLMNGVERQERTKSQRILTIMPMDYGRCTGKWLNVMMWLGSNP